LCLDPKDLNKAIKRPHHRTPTIDEILPKLNGAQYFSIVDARIGYWNIKLDYQLILPIADTVFSGSLLVSSMCSRYFPEEG
jgi:hypothetical protein